METAIIKIGNSKGLRLSKTILEKYNIKDKVELILEMGQIILKPIEIDELILAVEKIKAQKEGDQKLLHTKILVGFWGSNAT